MKPGIHYSLRAIAFVLSGLKMGAALVGELCLVNKLLCSGSKMCCEGKQSVCSSVCLACKFCWASVTNGFGFFFLYGLFFIPVAQFLSNFFMVLNKAQFLKETFRAFSSNSGFCHCHYRMKFWLLMNFFFLTTFCCERHVAEQA